MSYPLSWTRRTWRTRKALTVQGTRSGRFGTRCTAALLRGGIYRDTTHAGLVPVREGRRAGRAEACNSKDGKEGTSGTDTLTL